MRRAQTRVQLQYVAGNVRRLRVKLGLTQELLAERADLDVTYVQRIERAVVNLSVDVLVALAESLAVSPNRLMRKTKLPETKVGRPRKRAR